MKIKKKENSGITLVALVVTIVVMLILAGISLNLILGNQGILNRSKEGAAKYSNQTENEQKMLNDIDAWIDENVGGGKTPSGSSPIKVAVNEKATSNGTINGKEASSNNPIVPEGYTPINTDTSNWGDGTNSPTQDAVDHGLVIKDDSNNEWVWIPVDSATLATMYETSSDEKTLCGTAVKTKLYSKSEIISGEKRTTPGTSTTGSYREPDLVVSSGTSYDAKEEYYKDILGFESKEKMAEAFVADYNEMIASIGKYGGFYIGRYELSSEGVQKDKATLTQMNWYNLYNACRSSKLQASNKVKTQMIWGCQWDVTCNFIANKGDKKSITDSRTWGNYSNSTENAAVTVTESGTTTKKYGSKQNTGYSEYWKANNIYDLAGNCWEWTQEALYDNSRAFRGGGYNDDGSSDPASHRSFNYPDFSLSDYPGYISDLDDVRFSSHFNNKVALNARA